MNLSPILLFMTREGIDKAREIDVEFRGTQYAQHLKAHPRWSRFQPEDITNTEWRLALHADSDGLDNARLMIRLTEVFLQRDTDNSAHLSDEEKDLLYLAAAIQNWGKSFPNEQSPGVDISYEFITGSEIEQRRKKLHQLFDELAPELDVKKRFIIEKTIYDRNTKLGEVFDAIRKLNQLRTGLIAYNQYQTDPNNPAHTNLGALSLNVLSNQLIHLVTYAEKFTPVSQALEDSKDIIGQIFADRSIRNHPLAASQQDVDKVEYAETIWNRSHGEKSTIEGYTEDESIFSNSSSFEKRFINDKEQLRVVVESLKALGQKIVLTSGSFDLLHIGHAKYLERAAEFGDFLVVGVDSDSKIKKRKGDSRPIVKEEERVRLLSHIRGVGLLTLKDADEERWGLIKLVHPHTLVVTAETYTPEQIRELEGHYCERVVVLEPQATTSTGAQIRRIQIGEHFVLKKALEEAANGEGLSDESKRELASIVLKLQGGS